MNNTTPLKAIQKKQQINLDDIRKTLNKLAQSGEFCPYTTKVFFQTIVIVEQFEELIFNERESNHD
jgi:hypothetical protein